MLTAWGIWGPVSPDSQRGLRPRQYLLRSEEQRVKCICVRGATMPCQMGHSACSLRKSPECTPFAYPELGRERPRVHRCRKSLLFLPARAPSPALASCLMAPLGVGRRGKCAEL